jgi:hypothetical protein
MHAPVVNIFVASELAKWSTFYLPLPRACMFSVMYVNPKNMNKQHATTIFFCICGHSALVARFDLFVWKSTNWWL